MIVHLCSLKERLQTKIDLRFYRNLHLNIWHHQISSSVVTPNAKDSDVKLFLDKVHFCPINNNPILNTFTKKVSSEVERVFHAEGTHQYNLTKRQNDALDRLSTRDDVMIKDADKRVAVWSKDK